MAASVDARMVAWVDGESINAGGLRLGQAASSMGGATALASRGGVRPSGGEPGLIAALPTPGMKVRVTPGIFVVPSASPTGGEYRIALETQTDLDIDNSGSFPRTDLVIAEVVDTGTSAATATVRVLKGPTDSPGAARPTNTTPNAHYIVLGSVDVRVGAESSGNIRVQDVHPERQWAVAAGAIQPVATLAERDALTGYEGLYVDRADNPTTGPLERHDGTGFKPASSVLFASFGVLAGAAPADGTPLLEQTIVSSASTSSGGDMRIVFPRAFPNGLVSCHVSARSAALGLWLNDWAHTLTYVDVRAWTGAAAGATAVASTSIPYKVTLRGW